jgi:DNA-binding NarL/FixJ family response regulator
MLTRRPSLVRPVLPPEARVPVEPLSIEVAADLSSQLRTLAFAQGQSPQALAQRLLARSLEQEARRARAERSLTTLTPRQQEVAWLAASGSTNRQIAEALVVSTETVKTHVANVLERFGLRSKAELRLLLLDLGLQAKPPRRTSIPTRGEFRPPARTLSR